ncbi:MAG: PadR family transcriptional regulator [Anaerolineales bacterium]|nr:PadR family transcriptional regulator [Anaerolineales bacterium]
MTNAELAILSLIAQQPRYGYQIEHVIEERGMREWTEVGFSSIYYLLKKLEGKKLIKSQLEVASRGPARKVYYITPQGEKAVYEGAIDALSVPRRNYPHFLVGLSILPKVGHIDAADTLGEYRAALFARRENMQTSMERQRPLPYFVEAMFDYSQTLVSAEIDWVEKFIQQLKSLEGDTKDHKEPNDEEN